MEAISRSCLPEAAARTKRQRKATCCGVLGAASHRTTCSRSSAAKLTSGLILAMRTHISYWPQYVYLFMIHTTNTWDNNRHGDPIVKFHDNRFGGGFGGPLLPGKFLGGKTYFYGFYEGRRFPGTAQIQEWTVPSAAMRAGIIKLRDPDSKVVKAYNLK